MKKTLRDIINLHMYIINDDDMMHGFLDMEHEDRIFIILAHFLFLYLTGKLKSQNFAKKKKAWRFHHFTLV